MKKFIFLLIAVSLLFSCSDSNHAPTEKVFEAERSNTSPKRSLIEQKFKEFYDLNVLLKNYPDFKSDIERRIQNFTSNSETIFELNDSISITNIRQKGVLIQVSDSVQMTHVLFDVVSKNQKKTDSVLAFISKKKIYIDSEEVIATKVKFTRVVIQNF